MAVSKAILREETVAEVVATHRGNLLPAIRRVIRDQYEAEDVLQDVFVEFVEAYDIGTAIETLGAWLMRVAQNKVLDRLRRRKTQGAYRDRAQSEAESEPIRETSDDWMQDWIREEIVDAIEELPQDQRDVFVKHELEGKSFEEIATETGVKINTLLSRKRYAVQALRLSLKEMYDELE